MTDCASCNYIALVVCRYPLVEVQCINGRMLEEHAVAACGRAEEELALLSQQPAALDHNTLR